MQTSPALEPAGHILSQLLKAMQENKSKLIEIKKGNKTTYCFKKPEEDLEQKDLTTSGRHSIGYSDISKEQWDKIFKK